MIELLVFIIWCVIGLFVARWWWRHIWKVNPAPRRSKVAEWRWFTGLVGAFWFYFVIGYGCYLLGRRFFNVDDIKEMPEYD